MVHSDVMCIYTLWQHLICVDIQKDEQKHNLICCLGKCNRCFIRKNKKNLHYIAYFTALLLLEDFRFPHLFLVASSLQKRNKYFFVFY